MADRILTWHVQDVKGNNVRIGPAYFIEAEYEPVAARIHAETAPRLNAKFDIFDDGISIFKNSTTRSFNRVTGKDTTGAAATEVELPAGASSEDSADDFNNTSIEVESWVTCKLINCGEGKNFTIHLELRRISDEEEDYDD